ncbi:MAG: hypothetical protein ACI4I1_05640 [Oscillospiraceae bacterium]
MYKSVVSSRQSKKEVRISYKFSYEPEGDLSEPIEPLEYFDLLVLDIIYYLWINRLSMPSFSINDLIYIATGKVAYLQKGRIEKFRHSIKKLSSIVLEIDCSEELEMREKGGDFESVIKGRLAPICISSKSVQRDLAKNGDSRIQEYDKITYKITEEPVLYRYTDINNQIIAVPLEMMLSKGANVKNTDRALLVKYYLIRELELIRKSTERKKFRTQSFNDRVIRFISKTNSNNCLMQQIDGDDTLPPSRQIVSQRDIFGSLTKGMFINETKSVKKIVEKYLSYFTEMGYLSGNASQPQNISRNTLIEHICNEFSKRYVSGSSEAELLTHLADNIKGDEKLSDEQLKTAERILLCGSAQGRKPPYTFIYRSEDERGAVIGVEVETINDPNSIAWGVKPNDTNSSDQQNIPNDISATYDELW